MQIHQVVVVTKKRKSRRVGRGGKRGTYSGRGIKGLGARAGGKKRPAEREILKKIPKLRGYKFKSFHAKSAVVNLVQLAKRFEEGETVSSSALLGKGLIRRTKGKEPRVKILGDGDLKKKLIFKEVTFSKSAADKARR